MPYVDKMFDLFNASYASLSSFVAISDTQKEYFKKKYIKIELIWIKWWNRLTKYGEIITKFVEFFKKKYI